MLPKIIFLGSFVMWKIRDVNITIEGFELPVKKIEGIELVGRMVEEKKHIESML